jgi:hypothetical protein
LQKTLRTSTKELSTSNKAVERMESIQKDNTTLKEKLKMSTKHNKEIIDIMTDYENQIKQDISQKNELQSALAQADAANQQLMAENAQNMQEHQQKMAKEVHEMQRQILEKNKELAKERSQNLSLQVQNKKIVAQNKKLKKFQDQKYSAVPDRMDIAGNKRQRPQDLSTEIMEQDQEQDLGQRTMDTEDSDNKLMDI